MLWRNHCELYMRATTCMIEHDKFRRDVLYKYFTSPSRIDFLQNLTELMILWWKSHHFAQKRTWMLYQHPKFETCVPFEIIVWKRTQCANCTIARYVWQNEKSLLETSRLTLLSWNILLWVKMFQTMKIRQRYRQMSWKETIKSIWWLVIRS